MKVRRAEMRGRLLIFGVLAALLLSGCNTAERPEGEVAKRSPGSSNEVRAAAQVEERSDLPTVVVLGTGGTIASTAEQEEQRTKYEVGLTADQLLEAVPAIKEYAKIEAEQFTNINSPAMTPKLWLELADRVNKVLARPEVAGVVITHGTSTLEETAYFLNLTVKSEKPVVLTGAQRPATAISADGPLNLLDAVRVSTAPQAVGRGVLVVLNDEISAARYVSKTDMYRVETFDQKDLGFLGYVDEDQVTFYQEPVRRHTVETPFKTGEMDSLPRVDIVYQYAGADNLLVDAAVKEGVEGLVVAGVGAGSLTPESEKALKEAAESGVAVVISSRVGNGRVVPLRFEDTSFIAADNLNPQHACVLLMLALIKTQDRGEIQEMFWLIRAATQMQSLTDILLILECR
jgi:L-asparaginase